MSESPSHPKAQISIHHINYSSWLQRASLKSLPDRTKRGTTLSFLFRSPDATTITRGDISTPSRAPGFAAVLLTNANEPSHQIFTSSDGRTLSYATYGAPTGPTVFHLHSLGDSCLTAALSDFPGKSHRPPRHRSRQAGRRLQLTAAQAHSSQPRGRHPSTCSAFRCEDVWC